MGIHMNPVHLRRKSNGKKEVMQNYSDLSGFEFELRGLMRRLDHKRDEGKPFTAFVSLAKF